MATTADAPTALLGSAAPSPAGPLDAPDPTLRTPPQLPLSPALQTLRFAARPLDFNLWARRHGGETFAVRFVGRAQQDVVATSHPDHVKSLFTAKPADAPSLTGESPLRPILGPDTVLTAIGARHMRQRKLLLPSFHGDAVRRYVELIEAIVEREIDHWPVGEAFPLAPRMQAVTLDVIMAGIFGFEGRPAEDSAEAELRRVLRRVMALSTRAWWPLVEAPSAGQDRPVGLLARVLAPVYAALDRVVAARRAMPEAERGADVLSLLLSARDEDGTPLTDVEVRNELLTLVLAGHETSANSLAWIHERLLRFPAAYDRLREAVRAGGQDGEAYVEATIHEGMRVRPVIPLVGRIVQRPWQLGAFMVPAGTPVALNIVLLHHREDLYPEPFAFRPERFLGVTPGTYTWIPFGGGIRRCLGAALALAEQRVVLREITRRTDLRAPDPRPERARLRNVTLIPARGGEVVVTHRRA